MARDGYVRTYVLLRTYYEEGFSVAAFSGFSGGPATFCHYSPLYFSMTTTKGVYTAYMEGVHGSAWYRAKIMSLSRKCVVTIYESVVPGLFAFIFCLILYTTTTSNYGTTAAPIASQTRSHCSHLLFCLRYEYTICFIGY